MREGEQQVLDLFCGAGGLTCGCIQAGYDVIAGVDCDETAIATYRANFDHKAIQCDLATTDPRVFAIAYGIAPEDVNIVVGGPPCQGVSRANTERSVDDPRNKLVFRFADYVDYYQPRSFVMENVTGIETIDDGEMLSRLISDFEAAGYHVDHSTLNAADYGVPQKRRRVFVVGVRWDADGEPRFPEPTHAPPSEVTTDGQSTAVMVDD